MLLGLIFILFSVSYEEFLKFILTQYEEPDKIERLKKDYLTVHTFEYLRFFLLFFTAGFMVCFFLFRRSIQVVSLFLYGTFSQSLELVKKTFWEIGSLTLFQKICFFVFLVILIGSRIFYMLEFPLVHDELFSFMYLVDKGFLPSAAYYPGPNNHIFFSEIAVLFNTVLDNNLLVMRLPSLLAGILGVVVLFVLINRRLGFEVAFLASCLFAFSYNIFFYSTHGRGYAMLYLFFILAFFCLMKITDDGGVKRIYKIIFVTACIMGFYTIPVFLYPYTCLFIFGFFYFLLNGRTKDSFHFIVLNLFVAGIVLFLYLPVFFLNGMDAVTGNSWVQPFSYDVFFSRAGEYLLNTLDYLWNLRWGGWIITAVLFISGIVVMSFIQHGKMAACILLLVLLPFALLIIQRVLPFYRVWDYLMVVFAILFGLVIQFTIENITTQKINNVALVLIPLIIIGANIYFVQSEVQNGFPYYSRLNAFMDKAFQEKAERVFVGEDTYHLFMSFEARERKVPMEIFSGASPHSYDLVVIPAKGTFPRFINPKHYKPYIFNGYVRTYKKK